MSNLFEGKHLRVLTPKTVDGMTPIVDEDDRVVYKEDFLPYSAKKMLEEQNKDLPGILKKKIEIVGGDKASKSAGSVSKK